MLDKIYHLKHNKKLKLNVSENEIDFDLNRIKNEEVTVYTFSRFKSHRTLQSIKTIYVDGATRFLEKQDKDVAIINAESLSPFFANVMWDLTHQLHVGNKIYIYETSNTQCVLERKYYKAAFKLLENDRGLKVYEKISELLVEKNRGLSSWTFGIPVGPEEPSILNHCVNRILELGIDDIEIILCGMPHEDFKFFDKVKIIGVDIKAPPVHITRKKNEIAKYATKDNLCILHERVYLPLNFRNAVEQFGDMFSLVGFQSIYFSDYINLIPRRYSDFGVLKSNLVTKDKIFFIDKKQLPQQLMKIGCIFQHGQRADFGLQFLTGSLYISKRELWNFCPQNENYYWDESEDIEFSLRAASYGIPVSVNPYSFTQSMNTRSIMQDFGYVAVKKADGSEKDVRSIFDMLLFIKLKPLFRITENEARKRFCLFAQKYKVRDSIILDINSSSLNGVSRYRLIFKMIMQSSVNDWEFDEYINDLCFLLLHEDMPPIFKENIKKQFYEINDAYSRKLLLLKHFFVINQLSYSLNQSMYLKNADDIFVKKNYVHDITAFLWAFYWKCFSKTFYFKLSIREIYTIIKNTTPFKG